MLRLIGFTLLAVVISASDTRAGAVLTHSYDLAAPSGLNDLLGGPALVNNGAILSNAGLAFEPNQGPSLSGAINVGVYSIAMRFSIDETGRYKKIIDFKDRESDNGVYNLDTTLNFYPVTSSDPGVIIAGQIIDLVVTRDASGLFTGYVGGVAQLSFLDVLNYATFTGPDQIIHFLRDDLTTTEFEASSGLLKNIEIYDDAMTPEEVRRHQFRPFSAVPEPSTFALATVMGLAGLALVRRRKSA